MTKLMTSTQKTVALISAAHIHTPNFIKLMNARDDIAVTAVWDDNSERGQKAAADLGATFRSDIEAIWSDDSIEAVIICSETNKHEALVLAAVNANKHIFVEKPLGFESEDAYKMAEAINTSDKIFQTGFFMRGWPFHIFLKEQITKGNFGKLTRIRHSNCHEGSLKRWFDTDWRWMADPSIAGCGAFGDLGSHSLDVMLWMMGDDSEVEEVTATMDIVTNNYEGCDEFGEALLKFKNGTVGSIVAGWLDIARPFRLQISGTEGHAIVMGDDLYFQSEHVEGSSLENIWTDLPEQKPHAFTLFLDALTGQNVTLISADECAYQNAVMEAIYKANETRTWVKPKIA